MAIKTSVDFGGFYYSIHSDNIDQLIESYHSDDNGFFDYDSIADSLDYKTIHNNYINEYVDIFKQWLNDRYELNIEFNNVSLYSPKYYNYSTDQIDCEISERDNALLIQTFKRNKDFILYLSERTKNSSGFISHYTLEQALNDKDNILSVYIFAYLAMQFNEDDFYSYYDRNYCYDNIL
jgi:hypothetical protein